MLSEYLGAFIGAFIETKIEQGRREFTSIGIGGGDKRKNEKLLVVHKKATFDRK